MKGAAALAELFTFLTGSVKGSAHTHPLWIRDFLFLLETLKQWFHTVDISWTQWHFATITLIYWQPIIATGTPELLDITKWCLARVKTHAHTDISKRHNIHDPWRPKVEVMGNGNIDMIRVSKLKHFIIWAHGEDIKATIGGMKLPLKPEESSRSVHNTHRV